jgi:hypothetical protein
MISEIAWTVTYLACLLLVGCALIQWLAYQPSRLEAFGLALCIGPCLMGGWLILWSFLDFIPSRFLIFSLSALAVISILLRHARVFSPSDREATAHSSNPIWAALPIAAFAYGLCFVVHDALLVPTVDWDAFATWQLKAKVLYYFPLVPRPAYFSNVGLSYSHLRYPILVPIISTGSMAMMSTDASGLAKSPALILYAGLAAALFAFVRNIRGIRIASIVTALFVSLPMLVESAGVGGAEMTLVALYGSSLICLLRWLQRQRPGDLILAALFSAAMMWTKNEGIPLAIINGLMILLFTPRPLSGRNLALAAAFAAILACLYLPWVFYARTLPRTDEDYLSHLSTAAIITNLPNAPHILARFFFEMIALRHSAIFWVILAALQLINWKTLRDRRVLMIWAALLLQIGAVTLAYMVVTLWKRDDLIGVSVDRMVLHLSPAVALLIALQWPEAKPVA